MKEELENTMSTEPVKTTINGSVLEVVLDRPKANAIDAPTSRKLGRHSPRSGTIRRFGSRLSPVAVRSSSAPAGISSQRRMVKT